MAAGVVVSLSMLAHAVRMAPLARQPTNTPSLPKSWSNPCGADLVRVADGVFLAERPFYPSLPGLQRVDVGCKMAVVQLPSGGLFVHSPVRLDDGLRREIDALGPVECIVTPNSEHMLYAQQWIDAYPAAVSYAAPGLRERYPHVKWQRSLAELVDDGSASSARPPPEWGGAIELCWVKDRVPLTRARPFFNEVVFCHRPSGALIVTDLWWNYPGDCSVPLGSRLWKRGMDEVYKPVYNRFMKADGWAESADVILGWDFNTILPAHGDPIVGDAKGVLRRHLGLPDRPD